MKNSPMRQTVALPKNFNIYGVKWANEMRIKVGNVKLTAPSEIRSLNWSEDRRELERERIKFAEHQLLLIEEGRAVKSRLPNFKSLLKGELVFEKPGPWGQQYDWHKKDRETLFAPFEPTKQKLIQERDHGNPTKARLVEIEAELDQAIYHKSGLGKYYRENFYIPEVRNMDLGPNPYRRAASISEGLLPPEMESPTFQAKGEEPGLTATPTIKQKVARGRDGETIEIKKFPRNLLERLGLKKTAKG